MRLFGGLAKNTSMWQEASEVALTFSEAFNFLDDSLFLKFQLPYYFVNSFKVTAESLPLFL
jgi:hypothetical protein